MRPKPRRSAWSRTLARLSARRTLRAPRARAIRPAYSGTLGLKSERGLVAARISTSLCWSLASIAGEVGLDMPVGVAEIIGDRSRRGGVDAGGERDEHGVGVGDRELVGEGPAPVPTGETEAVHRYRGNARAVAGVPRQARGACSAVDLKRHDDTVADAHRGDLLADGEHLGDAFVSEVQWQRELRRPEDQWTVEVAGRGGDRVDDRAPRPGQQWRRCGAPA